MLTKVKRGKQKKTNDSFAIVASRYNGLYVDAMLRAARKELLNVGAKVRIVRVPGAFEIPTVAARLAEKLSAHSPKFTSRASPLSGIICLGVIFQGETSHAQHIGWGVTHALAQIQVQYKIPVVHGVFVFEKEKQAKVRCLSAKHNRGTEAAQAALQMAQVMAGLH